MAISEGQKQIVKQMINEMVYIIAKNETHDWKNRGFPDRAWRQINAYDNGAPSVGAGQWRGGYNGKRAAQVLSRCINANLSQANAMLGATTVKQILSSETISSQTVAGHLNDLRDFLDIPSSRNMQLKIFVETCIYLIKEARKNGITNVGGIILIGDRIHNAGNCNVLHIMGKYQSMNFRSFSACYLNAVKAQSGPYARGKNTVKYINIMNANGITKDSILTVNPNDLDADDFQGCVTCVGSGSEWIVDNTSDNTEYSGEAPEYSEQPTPDVNITKDDISAGSDSMDTISFTEDAINVIMDKLNGCSENRTKEPPHYFDNIPYEHRIGEDSFSLLLGDSFFIIPPEFISIDTTYNVEKQVCLRQENTDKITNGYHRRTITIQLVLNGMEQINGYSVNSPESHPYQVDGLRPLLAQFKTSPFLPVVNDFLNVTHNIYNVALSNIICSTINGFPNTLMVTLTLHEFLIDPYIECPGMFYKQMIDWDLYRFYYQRLLYKTPGCGLYLKPITTKTLTNRFQISVLNPGKISGKLKDEQTFREIIANKENYDVYMNTDTDDIVITAFQFGLSNIMTAIQMADHKCATMQYLGGMDTIFSISVETKDISMVQKLHDLQETATYIARENRKESAVGFIRLTNELVSLTGCEYVIIENCTMQTVPGFPGLYQATLQFVSYNPNQSKRNDIKGIRPFPEKGTSGNAITQDPNGLIEKITQDTYAMNELRKEELYPDLYLPTIAEVNTFIEACRKFRSCHDNADGERLGQLPYTEYPLDVCKYFLFGPYENAYSNAAKIYANSLSSYLSAFETMLKNNPSMKLTLDTNRFFVPTHKIPTTDGIKYANWWEENCLHEPVYKDYWYDGSTLFEQQADGNSNQIKSTDNKYNDARYGVFMTELLKYAKSDIAMAELGEANVDLLINFYNSYKTKERIEAEESNLYSVGNQKQMFPENNGVVTYEDIDKYYNKYTGYMDPDFYVFYPNTYKEISKSLQDSLYQTKEREGVKRTSTVIVGVPTISDSTITDSATGETISFMDKLDEETGYALNATLNSLRSKNTLEAKNRIKFIQKLCSKVGYPYVWATAGPNTWDCSGFVTWGLKDFVSFPGRLTTAHMREKTDLFEGITTDFSKLEPGDVLLKNGHTGVFIGNNQFIHASKPKPYPVGGVKITDMKYGNWKWILKPKCFKTAHNDRTYSVSNEVNDILNKDTSANKNQPLNNSGESMAGIGVYKKSEPYISTSNYKMTDMIQIDKVFFSDEIFVACKNALLKRDKTIEKQIGEFYGLCESQFIDPIYAFAMFDVMSFGLLESRQADLFRSENNPGALPATSDKTSVIGSYQKKRATKNANFASFSSFHSGAECMIVTMKNYIKNKPQDFSNLTKLIVSNRKFRTISPDQITLMVYNKYVEIFQTLPKEVIALIEFGTESAIQMENFQALKDAVLTDADGSLLDYRETIQANKCLIDQEKAKNFGSQILFRTQWDGDTASSGSKEMYEEVNKSEHIFNTSGTDMISYSKKGRLLRAFPTYTITIIDQSEKWLDGRKLWSNLYITRSAIDLNVYKDNETPVETATISVYNARHSLDYNPINTQYMISDDTAYGGVKQWIYKNFGVLLGFGPKLTDKLIEIKNELYESIRLTAGCRIQLRMGYGSDPCMLPITFNGTITDVSLGDAVSMVAISDGNELMNAILNKSSNSSYTEDVEGSNEVARLLCERDSDFWNSVNEDWFEASKNYIENFGLFMHKGLFESIKDKTSGTTYESQYDICKNIYKANNKKEPYIHSGWVNDDEFNFRYNQFQKTPWDVMIIAANNTTEYIVRPMNHEFESRIFYGLPYWTCKYSYKLVKETLYEEVKTFAQFHYLGSMGEIIDNKIKVSSSKTPTNIAPIYIAGESVKNACLLFSDKSIDWSRQKTKVLDTSLKQDYIGPEWAYEFVGIKMGKNAAIRCGISELLLGWQRQYSGAVTIMGNASIKPEDYVYLDDSFAKMQGLTRVRCVVHSMNSNTGFTTNVTPGLLAFSVQYNSAQLEHCYNLINLGISMSAKAKAKQMIIKAVDIDEGGIYRLLDYSTWMALGFSGMQWIAKFKVITTNIEIGKKIFNTIKTGTFLTQVATRSMFVKDAVTSLKAIWGAANAAKSVAISTKIIKSYQALVPAIKGITAGLSGGLTVLLEIFVWDTLSQMIEKVTDYFKYQHCVKVLPLLYEENYFLSGYKGAEKLIINMSNEVVTGNNNETYFDQLKQENIEEADAGTVDTEGINTESSTRESTF